MVIILNNIFTASTNYSSGRMEGKEQLTSKCNTSMVRMGVVQMKSYLAWPDLSARDKSVSSSTTVNYLFNNYQVAYKSNLKLSTNMLRKAYMIRTYQGLVSTLYNMRFRYYARTSYLVLPWIESHHKLCPGVLMKVASL